MTQKKISEFTIREDGEQTLPVYLSLEESGILYHLVLTNLLDRKIIDYEFRVKFEAHPSDKRLVEVLLRLGAVNDKLMGKK